MVVNQLSITFKLTSVDDNYFQRIKDLVPANLLLTVRELGEDVEQANDDETYIQKNVDLFLL